MRPVVLDTNAYVAFKRGDADILAILRAAERIYLPSVVLEELLAGFAAGNWVAVNREELARFLQSHRVATLPVGDATADHYALIFARLPAKARQLIAAPENRVFVSAASVWEIAIKHGLGRGDMPISGDTALGYFREAGYQLLPVLPEHTAAVEALPPHHAAPFDRLLVAQALAEPLRLLTHDALLARYSDTVMLL